MPSSLADPNQLSLTSPLLKSQASARIPLSLPDCPLGAGAAPDMCVLRLRHISTIPSYRAQLSLSLRAPVLVTALSTHAHSRSSVSCQTRLRVSKLCRWPGSQRSLNCRPPLFCARCLLYMCSKFLNKMLTETY